MSKDFRIEEVGKELLVTAPYNADFIKKVKTIQGRHWDASKKAWVVPKEAKEAVRKMMQQVYGRTDEEPTETVDLEIYFGKEVKTERAGIVMFGKNIATAYGRDTGADFANDVEVLGGEAISGGSRNYWSTIITEGTLIRVYDVPLSIYEREINNLKDGVEVEIVNQTTVVEEMQEGNDKRIIGLPVYAEVREDKIILGTSCEVLGELQSICRINGAKGLAIALRSESSIDPWVIDGVVDIDEVSYEDLMDFIRSYERGRVKIKVLSEWEMTKYSSEIGRDISMVEEELYPDGEYEPFGVD